MDSLLTNKIYLIVTERDGLSHEDAVEFLEECVMMVDDGEGIDEVLREELCLEEDYIFDFIDLMKYFAI